jgi:hypothetical protein
MSYDYLEGGVGMRYRLLGDGLFNISYAYLCNEVSV